MFYVQLATAVVFASENWVQVPDQCYQDKVTPCLIQFNSNENIKWNTEKLVVQAGALLKINVVEGLTDIEVKAGLVKVESTKKYKISGYEITTNKSQYIKNSDQKIMILDSKSLDLKTLIAENSKTENSSSTYVLFKSDLLSRKNLVEYLSQFYSNQAEFKKDLGVISKAYQLRLDSDLFRQAKILQDSSNREIASAENEEKRRIAEKKQNDENRKRSRNLFFMRTFEQ